MRQKADPVTGTPIRGAGAAEEAGAAAGASGDPAGRRRLLIRLWAALGFVALGEAVWVTVSFLRPRSRDLAASAMTVAGRLDDFEPGSVTAFPAGKFYLVRLKEGGFMALHRECTHLGCTVPWDAAVQRFACPCHASTFDLTGMVVGPPAPRPLDYYVVRLENDLVKVDTRRRLTRQAFDPSQVATP